MINFYNKLKDVSRASLKQQREELWDVEGVLHNQKYKFDLRPLKNNSKSGFFKTKADKIVYDVKDEYVVVDVEELHSFLQKQNTKVMFLDKLLPKLEWSIIIKK